MNPRVTIVITTISPPNDVQRALAELAEQARWGFVVAGDSKSPRDFDLPGARFLSLGDQLGSGFGYAQLCPTGHYARKNVGYLDAIRAGCDIIVETDDDNYPRAEFFAPRSRVARARLYDRPGWVNLYRYFTEANIWPRGLPLDEITAELPAWDDLPEVEIDCPIQQGLADENPDVDAIYRLTLPLPQNFRSDRRVVLAPGSVCPFNSQNTTWFAEAFPLLYLPACCSFRMTDIWRSFVAQRIARANGWGILFHEPTVWQDRNEHDLMRDFADEVPGYLNNRRLMSLLDELDLAGGTDRLGGNLLACYEQLVRHDIVGPGELPLVQAWLDDLTDLTETRPEVRATEMGAPS